MQPHATDSAVPQSQPYGSLVPCWIPGAKREVARTRVLTLQAKHWTSAVNPDRQVEYVFMDAPAWCHVIAVTPRKDVVMIEQFRHALGEVTLELPGGMVDAGETPDSACTRELHEETGYRGNWQGIIGRMSANPALLTNWCYTGLVTDAVTAGSQHLDQAEEIAVRLVPLVEVPKLIRAGIIHHSLVVAAFQYFSLCSMKESR